MALGFAQKFLRQCRQSAHPLRLFLFSFEPHWGGTMFQCPWAQSLCVGRAQGNIAAEMAAFEMNLPDRTIRAFARFSDRLTQGRDREDATARGHDLSVLPFRSGLKNPYLRQTGGIFQPLDSFSG